MFISKKKKLVQRRELEAHIDKVLDAKKYISLSQALELGKELGISKSSVYRIFNNLKFVSYVRVWNPGTIELLNEICPMHKNTMVAKRVRKKVGDVWSYSTFCTYDITDEPDSGRIIEVLKRRNFKSTSTFPPLVSQYYLLKEGGRTYILWSELEVNERKQTGKKQAARV